MAAFSQTRNEDKTTVKFKKSKAKWAASKCTIKIHKPCKTENYQKIESYAYTHSFGFTAIYTHLHFFFAARDSISTRTKTQLLSTTPNCTAHITSRLTHSVPAHKQELVNANDLCKDSHHTTEVPQFNSSFFFPAEAASMDVSRSPVTSTENFILVFFWISNR